MSGPSQATQLVDLALAARAHFFRSPEGDAYAGFPVSEHYETWPVRSRGFRLWLTAQFYALTKKTPNAQALTDALGALEGRAWFEGSCEPVFMRLAERDGVLYLDLGDSAWRTVAITPSGWEMRDAVPVRFRRTRGMLPLPAPERGGRLDGLRDFLNVDDDGWTLTAAWLVGTLRPDRPFSVLDYGGEQGSGKSTQARMLRGMVDPNVADLRSFPRDEHDLVLAAVNGWIIGLDNVSYLPEWLSDALCRLSTGAGFGKRQLYTDADESLFAAKRPIVLTGIEEVAVRGDLADRTIVVTLPMIPEGKRRTEDELWRAYEVARPRLLGALLDVAVGALGALPAVRLERLPRMADWAVWATAAEKALGWDSGRFMKTYTGNRTAANEITLEASRVGALVRALVADRGEWSGTAQELLDLLTGRVGEMVQREKTWPKSARALSGALRRLAPNLRAVGVQVEFSKGHHPRTIRVMTVPTVPTDPDPDEDAAEGDEDRDASRDADGEAGDVESLYSTEGGTQRDGRDAKVPTSSAAANGAPVDGAALLALAEARGFPRQPLRPHESVPAGRAAWATFIACGRPEDFAAAWTALAKGPPT